MRDLEKDLRYAIEHGHNGRVQLQHSVAAALLKLVEGERWIPVSERLPEPGALVLCWQQMTGLCLREITTDGGWFDEHNNFDDSELEIYYWRPLPAPPQENADD